MLTPNASRYPTALRALCAAQCSHTTLHPLSSPLRVGCAVSTAPQLSARFVLRPSPSWVGHDAVVLQPGASLAGRVSGPPPERSSPAPRRLRGTVRVLQPPAKWFDSYARTTRSLHAHVAATKLLGPVPMSTGAQYVPPTSFIPFLGMWNGDNTAGLYIVKNQYFSSGWTGCPIGAIRGLLCAQLVSSRSAAHRRDTRISQIRSRPPPSSFFLSVSELPSPDRHRHSVSLAPKSRLPVPSSSSSLTERPATASDDGACPAQRASAHPSIQTQRPHSDLGSGGLRGGEWEIEIGEADVYSLTR
ncbi:hypothetical protein K438DRAFT_1985239 [Mycena galopus ATCC 62051]|nr:hypothetical protein K438DRAFT_1985239 [Mycena galopus ATCC 62051]